MSKTRGEVRTEVRAALNEVSVTFWSDAQLDAWINEATRDMSRRAENLADVDQISIVAGTQDYAAGTDTIRVHRMEYSTDVNRNNGVYVLEPRSMAAMDQFWGINQKSTQGYPSFWTEVKSPPNLMFRLWPVPSQNGYLWVYFYRLAVDIATGSGNDSTVVDCHEGWYDAIVDYCEYRAKRKDNDPTWKDAKDIYEEKLNNLIAVSRDYNDEAGVFITRSGIGTPAWLYAADW